MHIFIPPYMGEEIKSNAERKMFEILKDLTLKNAYVLHSLGLPKHKSKIYGEIDFVVVCERGVACLEIKGGRVECRDGKWLFTDRYGMERKKPEGPFAQVTGNMFSLRNVLKDHFKGNPHVKDMLLASGVVFPDIEFTSASQEIIPEIVFDRRTTDITDYMNRIFDYWQERGYGKSSKLPPAVIEDIVHFLRADFTFIPTLHDRLEEVDKHLVHLTNEQAMVLDALSMNTHLMVEGNAGTGKTLLALYYARKMAEAGKKVLYLAYNKNLANSLNRMQAEEDSQGLKIINLHALFGEYVEVDTALMNENVQKYFSEILPERFFDLMSGMPAEDREALQYDLLVMDEGQDIIKPEYLYDIDLLLRGGLEKGAWAVFYDAKQNIYNPDFQDGMEILDSYHSTKFRLFINCRNTVQIGEYGSRASGVPMSEYIRENGEKVQTVTYQGEDDFKSSIAQILEEMRKEKVDLRDVVFLSPRKYEGSLLKAAGIKVNVISDDYDPNVNFPKFSTIQGFKGLDAKIVILADVEKIREEHYSKFIYIATTRARTLLYVVGSEQFWESHKV